MADTVGLLYEDALREAQAENARLRGGLQTVVTDLLSICDGSNWPESAQSGPGYKAYSEITEQLHEIAANLQGFLARRALRAREGKMPTKGRPEGDKPYREEHGVISVPKNDLARLVEERDLLRTALQQIANLPQGDAGFCREIASAALRQK